MLPDGGSLQGPVCSYHLQPRPQGDPSAAAGAAGFERPA
jgi:hypothetical protein